MHHITYNSRFGGWGHFSSCRFTTETLIGTRSHQECILSLASLTRVDYALVGTLSWGYSLLMSLPCLFFEKCLTHGSWCLRECNEKHFCKMFLWENSSDCSLDSRRNPSSLQSKLWYQTVTPCLLRKRMMCDWFNIIAFNRNKQLHDQNDVHPFIKFEYYKHWLFKFLKHNLRLGYKSTKVGDI